MIAPVLPKIKENFQQVPDIDLLVKLVLTLPAVFIVISSPIMGYLMDKYGRKKVILFSIFLYSTAGASGAMANSIYELLISRTFFGIAIGGVITGCSALIGDFYKGDQISKMIGLQSAFIGYSGIFYLFIGGLLADINWRLSFLVYLLPLVLFILFAIFINEPKIKKELYCGFNILETNNKPFLIKLLKIYIIAFGLMLFFYMVPLQVPFYLKSIASVNNTVIGLTMAIMSLFSATTSLFYKKIKAFFAFRTIFIISFIIMGSGYIILSSVPKYFISVIGLIFVGIGMGLIIPSLRAWVGSSADSSFMGRAFGGLTTSLYLGQFFSPILAHNIINFSGTGESFTIMGIFMVSVSAFFAFNNVR